VGSTLNSEVKNSVRVGQGRGQQTAAEQQQCRQKMSQAQRDETRQGELRSDRKKRLAFCL